MMRLYSSHPVIPQTRSPTMKSGCVESTTLLTPKPVITFKQRRNIQLIESHSTIITSQYSRRSMHVRDAMCVQSREWSRGRSWACRAWPCGRACRGRRRGRDSWRAAPAESPRESPERHSPSRRPPSRSPWGCARPPRSASALPSYSSLLPKPWLSLLRSASSPGVDE